MPGEGIGRKNAEVFAGEIGAFGIGGLDPVKITSNHGIQLLLQDPRVLGIRSFRFNCE